MHYFLVEYRAYLRRIGTYRYTGRDVKMSHATI